MWQGIFVERKCYLNWPVGWDHEKLISLIDFSVCLTRNLNTKSSSNPYCVLKFIYKFLTLSSWSRPAGLFMPNTRIESRLDVVERNLFAVEDRLH